MKMTRIILLLCAVVLIASCTEQGYFEIPRDANGNVLLTGISSTTTTGISTLDNQFSVTATFATARPGDVMKVELLQLQLPPSGGTTKQLIPLAGTQKEVTVGSDLTATVTYTRDEANLNVPTDYVTVVFNGATDYAKVRVDLVPATVITKPKVSSRDIEVARTPETAYFHVTVNPKSASYAGTLVARRKNGKNEPWVDVTGSPFSGTQPFLIPISGSDFAVGQDTMYYSFTASWGGFTDEVLTISVGHLDHSIIHIFWIRTIYNFKNINTFTLRGVSRGGFSPRFKCGDRLICVVGVVKGKRRRDKFDRISRCQPC